MPQINVGPISVDLQSGWTLSTVIFAGPQDDQQPDPSLLTPNPVRPFQRNLVVTCEAVPASVTADSYVKRQSDGLRKVGVAHGYARPPERVDLSGDREGVITEAVVVGPSGERVRQMQLVCVADGIAYTLITSHLDGAPFENNRAEFRAVLLSFK